MSFIKKITLLQYRNYTASSFEFIQGINCITGRNGSGKTNLLDAVYYLCYTKSYFSASQQNTAQNGTDGFRIEGVMEKNDSDETISCKWQQGKKELMADGAPYERMADHIGKYAAVMIAPDDIALINEGSEQRRKWVDGILAQTDRDYLERLIHYQRVLLQRNAWLKMQTTRPDTDSTTLNFYNQQLTDDGTYIYQRRKVFNARFLPLLQRYYEQLSGGREAIDMHYESDIIKRPINEWLEQSLQRDLHLQRTTKGIHKDDWQFVFDGMSLKQFGSQGQKKSFLFSLKLAQYEYLHLELGHLPILLLDDIFEKLDQNRMEALLHIIRGSGFGQVLLTDTHSERVQQSFGNNEEICYLHLQ